MINIHPAIQGLASGVSAQISSRGLVHQQQQRRLQTVRPFASLHLSGKGQTQPVNLSGVWVKDKSASESMAHAIELMQVGGLVRQAIKLIRGIEVVHNDEEFMMAVFSVFPWFKVRETYRLNGEPSQCKRRDLRKGQHTGRAEQEGQNVVVHLTWSDPHGGTGTDTFSLAGPDELHVKSCILASAGMAEYTTVYRRKGSKEGHAHH